MTQIRLSEKHGVNPSVMKCYFCMKNDTGVAMLGKLKDDAEAPRSGVYDREPCDECKGYMSNGIIVISVDAKKTEDKEDPWRSGGWVVMSEDWVGRVFDEPQRSEMLKGRWTYMEDEVWDMLHLPRPN